MSTHKQKFEIPLSPNLDSENALWVKSIFPVAGLDEAGRGAWAGPVYAAAVILRVNNQVQNQLQGVRDSKQMSVKQREYWAEKIKDIAFAWGIGFADNVEIDQIGIIASTRLAMSRAIEQLRSIPQHLLIDALRLPKMMIEQTAIIKGDQRSLSIAAASVLAKTARDIWMREIAKQYPDYGFAQHKGYGTLLHQAQLIEFGPSPIHRMSFRPMKAVITSQ